MIAFAALLCIWLYRNSNLIFNKYIKFSLLIVFILLLAFLIILQSITGIGIFLFISIIYSSKYFFKKFNLFRFAGFVLILLGISILVLKSANSTLKEYSTPKHSASEIVELNIVFLHFVLLIFSAYDA